MSLKSATLENASIHPMLHALHLQIVPLRSNHASITSAPLKDTKAIAAPVKTSVEIISIVLMSLDNALKSLQLPVK